MDEQEFHQKLELVQAHLQETIRKAPPGLIEIFLRMCLKPGLEKKPHVILPAYLNKPEIFPLNSGEINPLSESRARKALRSGRISPTVH